MPIEETTTKTITCKNCGSEAVVKFGSYKGVPRYWCKVCQRKFKADTDVFHMKVPAEYVNRAVGEYYAGLSINDIRNLLKQDYGYYPSKSVVFQWVNKYTDVATKHFKDYHPQVGDIWVADETMLDLDGQHKVWFYDIIDEKTRFLLASRVALSRTTHDAEMLMKEASKRAGKVPKEVITDQNYSYLDGIELTFGSETIHRQGSPFDVEVNTNMIERFHGTIKERTKVMRGLHTLESARLFMDGWLVHYNFFRPHMSLKDRTPASVAGIRFPFRNWKDITEQPYEKTARIPIRKALVTLEQPKTPRRKSVRISRKTPRISPRPPQITIHTVRLRKD